MTDKFKAKHLKDIVIPSKKVEVDKEQFFYVYGLPIDDMMQVFENYVDFLDSLATGDFESLGVMLKDAPDLVASIVCRSTGDKDEKSLETFKRLPTQVQSDALLKVMELTFPDQDLLGKWWSRLEDLVANLAKGYKNQIEKNQKALSGDKL